jgi:SAM-dependent methyltransferase
MAENVSQSMQSGEAEYSQEYLAYLARRPKWQQILRLPYFYAVRAKVKGPAVDIGCGTGALLAKLPPGSFGLEVNRSAVAFCEAKGLDVRGFRPDEDIGEVLRRELSPTIRTLVATHVLEHLDNPRKFLLSILSAARECSIERAIFVVPGEVGFRSDLTHRTFVQLDLFTGVLADQDVWRLRSAHYFPLPFPAAGRLFRHNELQVTLDRSAGSSSDSRVSPGGGGE